MASNRALRKASIVKEDEFYTKLSDIEKELSHYRDYFEDKVIFCNCDDPLESNFWKYFELNFTILGLKKLIATHYETDKQSYMLEISKDVNGDGLITSKDIVKKTLKQNGDFRSPECIELLKESDIVVTNPPFSLFREYIDTLIKYDKKFIIIGNQNIITYKEIFPLFKSDKIWLGYHYGSQEFLVPDDYDNSNAYIKPDNHKYVKFGNIIWVTNLEISKRNKELILYKKYDEVYYPKYDNFDAINVDKISEIPINYDGLMGVPITFLSKYSPKQFSIIDALNRYSLCDTQNTNDKVKAMHSHSCNINGKSKYFRIIIKKVGDK